VKRLAQKRACPFTGHALFYLGDRSTVNRGEPFSRSEGVFFTGQCRIDGEPADYACSGWNLVSTEMKVIPTGVWTLA
jgi:hypothetical protein